MKQLAADYAEYAAGEPGPDPRLIGHLQRLASGMSAVVIALGVLGLIGWCADLTVLKTGFRGGHITMKVNTAFAFVSAGAAVWYRIRQRKDVASLLACAPLVIGVLTIAEYSFRSDLGIDQLFIPDNWSLASAPGRMAVVTALCFALIGGAILLIDYKPVLTQVAASIVAFLSLTGVIAYLDGASSLYSMAAFGSMALNTAIALKLLAFAVLFSSPKLRVLQLMAGKSSGGTIARTMLPLALLLPITVNWLRLHGERAGWFDAHMGGALGTAVIVIVWEVLLWAIAEHVRRAEQAHWEYERKLREMEILCEKDEHFRLMVEGFPRYGVFMLDAEGRITTWNEGARRIAGYEASEVIGAGYERFFFDENAEQGAPEQILEVARRDGHYFYQGWRRRKDGTRLWIDSEIVAVSKPDKELRGYAIISRDATAQKQAEERILAANRHKSEFLANMSHELRTPLNAIMGFTAFLHSGKAGPLSQEQTEYLGDVLSSARQLLQLVNGVLDMTRIEAGRFEFDNQDVDLKALITEVCESLRGLAGEKHLQLETTIEGDTAATLDPVKLKQVLYNFLSNAIKFTPEQKQIAVRLCPETTAKFRLEVADEGIGIRSEDLGRLFKEFEQLDSGTTKSYQGAGLGLAITKRLVEAQGGDVLVSSTFGKGSTFSAVLPRHVSIEAFSELTQS